MKEKRTFRNDRHQPAIPLPVNTETTQTPGLQAEDPEAVEKTRKALPSAAAVIFLANMPGARNFTQTGRDTDQGRWEKRTRKKMDSGERVKCGDNSRDVLFFKAPNKPLKSQKRNNPAWMPSGPGSVPTTNQKRGLTQNHQSMHDNVGTTTTGIWVPLS